MAKFKTSETKNRPQQGWRKKRTLLFCVLGIVLACGFLYVKNQTEQVTPAQKQEDLNNALITAVRQDERNEVVALLHLGANPNGHEIIYQPSHSAAIEEARRFACSKRSSARKKMMCARNSLCLSTGERHIASTYIEGLDSLCGTNEDRAKRLFVLSSCYPTHQALGPTEFAPLLLVRDERRQVGDYVG